jgi:DNA-binding CsgD family transcriptional regulator
MTTTEISKILNCARSTVNIFKKKNMCQ